MTTIIYIYIFILLSMIVFNVFCVYIRKINDCNIIKKQKKIQLLIDKKNINRLGRKLKHTSYLIAFSYCEFKNDIKLTNLFDRLLNTYNKKSIIEKTYFVYVLSKFPGIYDNNNQIINFLINNSYSNSLYLSENCLKALYKISNPIYIVKAFKKMNYKNCKHHYKLLSDGLLTYQGDKNKLCSLLLDNYKNFNSNYRLAIINYFNRIDIDLTRELFNILLNEKDKEVKIALIRYFRNHKYDFAKKELIKLTKDDFEYAVASIQSLKYYDGIDVIKTLKNSLTNSNWYVRNRAAEVLVFKLPKNEVIELLKIDDKYAKDAITYQLGMSDNNA